jgi:RNA polymerase sigma-70 factor, ECF subfamily
LDFQKANQKPLRTIYPMTTATIKPKYEPEIWLKEYGDYLFQFAFSKIRNTQQAEDLVQETFLAALKAFEKFEGRSTVKTWLTSILKFKVMDHYRRGLREIPESRLQKEEAEFSTFMDSLYDADNHRTLSIQAIIPDGEEETWRKEIRQHINDCLDSVNPRYRQIFVMREIDDMKTDDICKEAGITASNFWVMLHRVRSMLQKCMHKKVHND